MICKCYRAEKNYLGKVGVCWGTQERDACSCGGDKSKCDFYPSVRGEEKKPVTNYDRLVSKSPEEMAKFITGEDLCELLCGSPPVCDGCWSCEGKMLAWLKQEAKE